MSKPYRVPWREAEIEYIEKKSRFIGHIYKIQTAEQAQEILAAVRKQYWDATHNVYAYILQNGVMRFSDDGEPQGTSGMPTLEVLKKEEVFDVMCVTTRYFGGTLLGAGGLVRAYGHTCKLALDAAGIAVMQPFAKIRLDCPYPLLEQVRRQLPQFEAEEDAAEFGASVALTVFLPREKLEPFAAHLLDATGGRLRPELMGEEMFARKLRDPS